MTRITEVFRKARESAGRANDTDSHTGASRDVDVVAEVPWDFPLTSRARGQAQGTAVTADSLHHLQTPSPKAEDEQVSRIAQRLFPATALGAAGPHSVLFTVAGAQGASAEVCAGTADALARQTAGSVCVVDANFRWPAVRASLGANTRGLSDALVSGEPLLNYMTGIRENLWLLPAGSSCAAAQPLLTGAPFAARLAELRTLVDYILIDVSPSAAHAEVMALGQLVDGVVLVVDAHATSRDDLRQANAALRSAHVRILGSILTNCA